MAEGKLRGGGLGFTATTQNTKQPRGSGPVGPCRGDHVQRSRRRAARPSCLSTSTRAGPGLAFRPKRLPSDRKAGGAAERRVNGVDPRGSCSCALARKQSRHGDRRHLHAPNHAACVSLPPCNRERERSYTIVTLSSSISTNTSHPGPSAALLAGPASNLRCRAAYAARLDVLVGSVAAGSLLRVPPDLELIFTVLDY